MFNVAFSHSLACCLPHGDFLDSFSGASRRRSRARFTRGVHRWITPRSIAYSSLLTENGCESSIANKTSTYTNAVLLQH